MNADRPQWLSRRDELTNRTEMARSGADEPYVSPDCAYAGPQNAWRHDDCMAFGCHCDCHPGGVS